MWWRPNGKSKRSKVPYKNGARIGAVSWELAIQIPKLLIPNFFLIEETIFDLKIGETDDEEI